MDLMTLAAKLTLDDNSFKSGISNAESMGERLAGKMSAMTVAVGNLTADVIRKSIAGIQNVIGGAIDGYADYQQLIGGVETLFKGSADKVAAYAKESFRNTGLSANDYMETVTSFSASLLQGLKGDTNAAADLANTAIQDMADNANKMGTDISAIQTAYQGFAKQNYTMLDNLKLGYGGTKEEMVRLVNDSGILEKKIDNLDGITFDQLIQAIHKIQEEMGITGTTASEAAETISGSKASLAAAWQDMLSAVGGEGNQQRLDETLENFKTSFSTYMDNFIPTLTTTIVNSGTLVEGIADAVASLPTNLLSKLGSAGLEAGTDMIDGAGEIINWLIDSIVQSLKDVTIDPSRVQAFGEALGNFVGGAVGNIITNLPAITEGLVTVGVTLAGSIITGIWEGLFGSGQNSELKKIEDELNNTITDAEVSSGQAQAILKYMEDLHKQYGDAAKETTEWKNAQERLEEKLQGSKSVFKEYGDDVDGAIGKLKSMAEELRKLAIQQAMQDKLTAQLKLLGEYESQKMYAESDIDMAEKDMEGIDRKRAESARAYARELMSAGWLEEDSSEWWTAKNTLETPGYAGTGVNALVSALQDMYEWNRTNEEDYVWNKSLDDDILSPETLNGLNAQYDAQLQKIEDANAAITAADDGITKTNQEISITMGIMTRMETELINAGNAAMRAAENLSKLAIVKPSIQFLTGGAGDGKNGITYMPRAVGIDYVPYDGFKTELHRGEAVITKEENQRRNGRMDYDALEASLEDAIERSISRMYLNVDGQRLADFTAKKTGSVISANERARVRGVGG